MSKWVMTLSFYIEMEEMSMDAKYMYLCAVEVGDHLYAGIIDSPIVSPGDLVDLDNGERGIVTRVAFTDTESDEYKLFTDFVSVDEITAVYRCRWNKTEESEEQ